VQSATYLIQGQGDAGVEWVDAVKASGRAEQAAYTPFVQLARNGNVNYVYNGSNDQTMINMRRESAAQGFEPDIWMCSISCYTERFKTATGVDGTYLAMQFLPFEEAGSNEELDNYLEYVETPDSFGAQAWMAAVLFQQAVGDIVEAEGPNALTRARLLEALAAIDTFDANGWMAERELKGGPSNCQVMVKFEGGEFVRLAPEEEGTFECNPDFVRTVTLDPTVAAAAID
jgi:ABC-type branched-subunit amino acid transport system substrate-binding protein